MAKIPPDGWVSVARAAQQLGENAETTRLRAVHGELQAEQRGPGRRWFIEPQSLARLIAARGGSRTADSRIDSLESNMKSLTTAVQQLRAEVEALRAGPPDQAVERDGLRRERDRYRADAATFREAAMRANAGQRSMVQAFRTVLDAVEENADALTEMLGPRSPDDVGAPPGAESG